MVHDRWYLLVKIKKYNCPKEELYIKKFYCLKKGISSFKEKIGI